MTELEKALSGKSYNSTDMEVIMYQQKVKQLLHEFNHAAPDDPRRNELLHELVTGDHPYLSIESDFKCIFGKNIRFKGLAMVNYNCTFLDADIITIGNMVLIGPGCCIVCTNHALCTDERLAGMFDNKPVTIGDNVWLGANVTVLPGVTIGDGAVIGAGSVVTKDIPANVIAVGNPCRVLREITDADRIGKAL